MGPETEFILKYVPAFITLIAAIMLIRFTQKNLFQGMVTMDMHKDLVAREGKIVKVQETFSNRLEEIGKQQEGLISRVHEEVRENSERLRTLELVFSDNIDAIRELSSNCEKHRKNIPDTEQFNQQRKRS